MKPQNVRQTSVNLKYQQKPQTIRQFSAKTFDFEKETEETLESLCERFEELLEGDSRMTESDVSLANGVLTVEIPSEGTYVINKQTPNQQIWLSSPISGPARFDFDGNVWKYKRIQKTLHQLLDEEIGGEILGVQSNFSDCYRGREE